MTIVSNRNTLISNYWRKKRNNRNKVVKTVKSTSNFNILRKGECKTNIYEVERSLKKLSSFFFLLFSCSNFTLNSPVDLSFSFSSIFWLSSFHIHSLLQLLSSSLFFFCFSSCHHVLLQCPLWKGNVSCSKKNKETEKRDALIENVTKSLQIESSQRW